MTKGSLSTNCSIYLIKARTTLLEERIPIKKIRINIVIKLSPVILLPKICLIIGCKIPSILLNANAAIK